MLDSREPVNKRALKISSISYWAGKWRMVYIMRNTSCPHLPLLPTAQPPQTRPNKKALKLKLRLTHPVKNKFPILAFAKLKVEVGRARLTISRFIRLKMERISSRLSLEMSHQSRWSRPSTTSSHSRRACAGSDDSRWLKSSLRECRSGSVSEPGIRRTRRPGLGLVRWLSFAWNGEGGEGGRGRQELKRLG